MNGTAIWLRKFIEGSRTKFIIPVYQRNYDWLIENCNQLFNDLVKLKQSGREKHFFGSIVTAVADSYGLDRLVIDGQQRITTISLLLLAGIRAVRDGKMTIINPNRLEEASETFLTAKYCSSDRKIKLVPIENDLKAYDRIVAADEEHFVEDSKMTRNYLYFYQLLTREPQVLTFDELLDCIEHLEIIAIELESSDDAQLIFESLNSTGLALEEADKIRNYLLMSLSADEQQRCFKDYWQKIEKATHSKPTMFLRDYLTIKQQMQRPVRLSNIYPEWKKYMTDKDRKAELAEMLEYSKFYEQVTNAKLATSKLSAKMRHICNIETDVANVFFISFLKYASERGLSEDEVYKVIDLIENYLARRIVCNLPGNALTQVFCALHKDVLRSIEEYERAGVSSPFSYPEILAFHILRRDGNYQLPRDVQFVEAIKTRDAYHMLKSFQIFLFDRLENAAPGEYNDVASDMKKKEATIEHIMPQTLSDKWKTMLGDHFEEVKDRYLHTFANLTLTGINSELSNKPFEIKRDGDDSEDATAACYRNSKYRLTRSVTECDKWTAEELEKRSEKMVRLFLKLYPMPDTAYKPLPKAVDEVSLEEETFSPTGRLLKGFRLFGTEYVESTWKDMLLKVVNIVMARCPDQVDDLYDKGSFFWTPQEIGSQVQYCSELAPGKFLWTSMDNKSKLRCLRYLFEKCDIAESELVFLLDVAKE